MFPSLFRANWLPADRFWTDFFFSTFFRQKKFHNVVGFGFFSIWGVKFVHEKVEKSKILPNPILIITNVFSMFLGFLRHPTIGLTPRLAHFMAILLNFFFSIWDPVHVHGTPWVFGTINWTPFGPNGSFSGTSWPKPCLLGSLRSLKKKFGQSSHNNTIWAILDFGGFRHGLGPGLAQMGPKVPQNNQKT